MDLLPSEVVCHIARFCSVVSVLNLQETSIFLRKCIQKYENEIWKCFLMRDYEFGSTRELEAERQRYMFMPYREIYTRYYMTLTSPSTLGLNEIDIVPHKNSSSLQLPYVVIMIF